MDNLYCLKCQSRTANGTKPKIRAVSTSRGNRSMAQTTCKVCKSKKSQFVKSGAKAKVKEE